jgi:FkbM family methyltransferase
MPNFYSQHGEDSLLWQLFQDSVAPGQGYFVEVGALDGRCLSNTLSFEEAGWHGLCVEAHSRYFDLLSRNRPGSTCVRAAVSDRDEELCDFHANHRGALSTLEPESEGFFREHYAPWFGGFELQRVRRARLDTLLAEAGAPARFEFLSIDVEGHELAVLAGLDFRRYSPRVVILEELTADHALRQSAFMAQRGYQEARQIGCNRLYCRYTSDAVRLRSAAVSTDLTRWPHPCDVAEPAA